MDKANLSKSESFPPMLTGAECGLLSGRLDLIRVDANGTTLEPQGEPVGGVVDVGD